MYLPNDPIMLLSVINTKLRDEFASLDDLTDAAEINQPDLIDRLQEIGYSYDPETNQFR